MLLDTLEELKKANYIRAYYTLPAIAKEETCTIVIVREAFIEHEVTFNGMRWTERKIIDHLTNLFQWK